MGESAENTPGRRAVSAMQEIKNEVIFKTPTGVPKRRNKTKVLEEEEYIEVSKQRRAPSVITDMFLQGMGKIIQRDFFPDLEKLKAQNEYLEAMEKNDVIKLRELHLKYSGRRPPTERSEL